MERVDGAQARLKLHHHVVANAVDDGGKGGWGSGEIETDTLQSVAYNILSGKGGWGSGEIETSSWHACRPSER